MATELEDLQVLRLVEGMADALWKEVVQWDYFARDTVGKQLTRAVDSIGANISESYGRYHFGEKLQFLYFARGSLFETKYWLNRILKRGLMPESQMRDYACQLSEVARTLNAFAASIKGQQKGNRPKPSQLRETREPYAVSQPDSLETFLADELLPLFSPEALTFIAHEITEP